MYFGLYTKKFHRKNIHIYICEYTRCQNSGLLFEKPSNNRSHDTVNDFFKVVIR